MEKAYFVVYSSDSGRTLVKQFEDAGNAVRFMNTHKPSTMYEGEIILHLGDESGSDKK